MALSVNVRSFPSGEKVDIMAPTGIAAPLTTLPVSVSYRAASTVPMAPGPPARGPPVPLFGCALPTYSDPSGYTPVNVAFGAFATSGFGLVVTVAVSA